MKFDFKNKNIIITGCNGNLGAKLSKAFLKLNANIIGVDNQLKSNIKSNKFKYYNVNFHYDQELKNFFNKINKIKIDILINNAAISYKGKFEKRLNKEMIDTFEINLLVPLKLIKFVCNQNNKSKDKVILNIASIYGLISPDHNLYLENKKNNSEIYGASKAGLIQITKYFAKYYSGKNIRINSISPGGFTDSNVIKDKTFIKKYSAKVPIGRMGMPEEIVPSAVFLCSNYASYINGHNLIIDGGMSV